MADDQGAVLNIVAERPCSGDEIMRNVANAMRLGLKDVQQGAARPDTLFIYANGPSAKDAPLAYPCMALNGAVRELYGRGVMPTWWVACDPQEIVANFIKGAVGAQAGYLLASRCHPAVFERLSQPTHSDRIQLWHIDDETADVVEGKDLLPDNISVTLCALFLAHYMGFRNIEVYGWDGSYDQDGNSHAVAQPHSANNVTAEFEGQTFNTTTTWLAELEDAVFVLQHKLPDLNITVHGNAMIPTVIRMIQSPEGDKHASRETDKLSA